MRVQFVAIAGLLALCLCTAVAVQAEEEEREEARRVLVLVNAQDHAGVAIEGVRFSITDADGERDVLETDEFGFIRHELVDADEDATPEVSVADDRFRSGSTLYSRRRSRSAITHHHHIQLFRSDPHRMTISERRSYLEALPAMLRRERREAGAESLPLSLAVFLDGVREQVEDESEIEFPPPPEEPEEPEEGEEEREPVIPEPEPPGVEVTVLDSMGQPAHRRLVLLWTDRGDDEAIHAVRRGRTDERGMVRFGGLEPDRLYRAETARDRDGMLARGTPFRAREDRFVELRPVVLREEQRALTGFVFDGEDPVRGATIRVLPSNQPELTVVTNEFGFFELSPLQPGEVPLSIRERGGRELRLPPLRPGRNEVVLPLDLLRVPAPTPAE